MKIFILVFISFSIGHPSHGGIPKENETLTQHIAGSIFKAIVAGHPHLLNSATSTIPPPPTVSSPPLEPGVVSTKSGKLRGQILTSRGGKKYYAFTGIPYAERAPRFEIAEPVRPWKDIRDAVNYSSICPQQDPILGKPDEVMGDEDCLYLNIYVPHEERCTGDQKLPVLFHIHGGAFTSGSGELYDPIFLMDECIIYVSANYRLGVLGFLTTDDGIIGGNLGMKDNLVALKWIHENVEYFRGDKNAITLTGISAGGTIVSHFMASPAAKGLFHRVIAQSGSTMTPFIIRDPKQYAVRLGKLLNCTDESSLELKECLRTKSYVDIIKEQSKITNWIVDFVRFGPVIEPTDALEPFQTKDPYLRIKNGEGSRVPLITGVIKDEGILLNAYAMLSNKQALDELNANWYDLAPNVFLYNHINMSTEERNTISDKIKEFYFQGKPIGPETAQGLIDSNSDRYFNYGSWEEATLHSKFAPSYHYTLMFKGNYSLATALFNLPNLVVSHGHDAQFLYKNYPIVPLPEVGSDRLRFSEHLIKLWVSFIKSGKPSDVYPNVKEWIPFTSQNPSTLLLDLPAENFPDFRKERMELWRSLNLRKFEFPHDA
ncbi:unnamed protein product [Allacma fusca]|uniref:Carboxylic ester hydrolase n=1 Tax=Allacma fusca TaxID=39272 RepID=A0A8J2P6C8_9HEXA|nr:unnamed protein product [Allacma fusca]